MPELRQRMEWLPDVRKAPSGVAFSWVTFSWPLKRNGLARRKRTKALALKAIQRQPTCATYSVTTTSRQNATRPAICSAAANGVG